MARTASRRRPRSRSLPSLRRQLDAIFSQYIRRRDATRDGFGNCVSCGNLIAWTEGQCGHFIPRQYVATRYDERNAHLQCIACNCHKHGNLIEYFIAMLSRYGQDVVDELRAARRTTVRLRRADFIEMIGCFSSKLAELE